VAWMLAFCCSEEAQLFEGGTPGQLWGQRLHLRRELNSVLPSTGYNRIQASSGSHALALGRCHARGGGSATSPARRLDRPASRQAKAMRTPRIIACPVQPRSAMTGLSRRWLLRVRVRPARPADERDGPGPRAHERR
jgi:hypothetical protein